MISIIVNISKNNGIGLNNDMLCYIKEDLARFKKLTLNKTLIMGRKTFQSLPKVLPNREHIVITTDKNFKVNNDMVEIRSDLDAVLKYYKNIEEEVFVIGGASIYALALDFADKLYLTITEKEFKADIFFPTIDFTKWNLIDKSEIYTDNNNGLNFHYETYATIN